MPTLTTEQTTQILTYLSTWPESLALYNSTPPTDSEELIQLSHKGRIASIEAGDLLEGFGANVQFDEALAYVFLTVDGGVWRGELPFRLRNNVSLTVNPQPVGSTLTYRIGPSSLFIATRPDLVQTAMMTLGSGTTQSVYDIEELRHGILEAQATDKETVLGLLKSAVAEVGRKSGGQPLEFILYSDDIPPAPKPVTVDLPPEIGLDCRTPMDYFLYGITSRRRVAAYLAFYHVLEFYMGEIEVAQLQSALRTVYSNNYRILDSQFAAALMREFNGLTKKANESELLDACISRIPDSMIRQIVENRRDDLPVYAATDHGLSPLAEAIEWKRDGNSVFKDISKWNCLHLRSQLSRRIYSFRNGLVHSKASERTNISLQTLESANWVVFDIGLMRDVAYALLSVGV